MFMCNFFPFSHNNVANTETRLKKTKPKYCLSFFQFNFHTVLPSIPLPIFDMITTDSFRVVFMDPPPATVPGDPEGRQIQFYWLILREGETIVQQPTIRPFEGTSFTFSNLMEGTMYSLEVDALVGSNLQFFDLDLAPQFISTRK